MHSGADEMPAASAAGEAAALAGLSQLALSTAMQLDVASVMSPGGGRLLAGLALHQWQHLTAAAVVAALVWLLWRNPPGRLLAVVLVIVSGGLLIGDHLAFGLYGEHLHPSMSEEEVPSPALLLDSAIAEWTPALTLDAILLGLATIALAVTPLRRRLGGPPAAWSRGLWRRRWVRVACALYLVLSLSLAPWPQAREIAAHPLAAFAATWGSAEPRYAPAADVDLRSLRFGRYDEPAEETAALARFATRLRRGRPNLLLIVLESVGAEQLLERGQVRRDVAPVLAEMADAGVLFDSVYTTTPTTHAALRLLQTGGQTVTWGLFDDALEAPNRGPTLARSLAGAGYRSAFLTGGDLAYAHTLRVLTETGYGLVFHAGSLAEEERERRRLNSWGVVDDVVFERARAWIDAGPRQQPFFLSLLTLATHHPYTVPGPLPPRRAGWTSRARYARALAHTDAHVGALLAALRDQGRLDDTVVAVIGDHGEAFGDLHRRRREMHGRRLFEETMRSFLLLWTADGEGRGLRSGRVGNLGDVAATLAAIAGASPPGPGQDLLSPNFEPRLQFFCVRATPAHWGLRDGRWKFIGGIGAERSAELYDLAEDPTEQRNLASARPDQVRSYDEICRAWYAAATPAYLAQAGGAAIAAPDPNLPGLRRVVIGADRPEFTPATVLGGGETPVAKLEWTPYGEDRRLRYDWRAPDGATTSLDLVLRAGEAVSTIVFDKRLTPRPGGWSLAVHDGDRVLAEARFEVAAPAR